MNFKRLRDWLSCPNLANPPEPIPGVKPAAERPSRKPHSWPLPQGRAAKIGDGRKLILHSAQKAFVISFRAADYGLLMEFSLWIAQYGLRITADRLDSYRWLCPKKADS